MRAFDLFTAYSLSSSSANRDREMFILSEALYVNFWKLAFAQRACHFADQAFRVSSRSLHPKIGQTNNMSNYSFATPACLKSLITLHSAGMQLRA